MRRHPEIRSRPGDEIGWEAGSDSIRIVPASIRIVPARDRRPLSAAERLALFDRATKRQRRRARRLPSAERSWSREQLYARRRD